MAYTVENCKTEDGLTLRRIRHLKCSACGARFFDDEAMHHIQRERAKHSGTHTVRAKRSNKTIGHQP